MVIRLTGWLGPLALCLLFTGTETISKNFVNSSMPEMRPTFVINFDMATIICQHSENPADLHLHEMSVLCDGKQDCYSNPAMHDESFPYCEKRCNSTCSNRGACLYDGDTSRCFCNSGFAGPMCEIVDENKCLDKPCHWLASCQDTVGGYKCQCLPGFRGDGHTCADIDECSEGIASCPYHADCVNLPGTSFCNCTAGYAPMGTPVERCADINECETGVHKCESYQMCQNTEGSFTCVDRCSPGYEYLNNECVDIDECRLERACDSHAECTNTPGGHTCACEPGWTGDGRTCSPTTDCSKQENICDRHAKCLNPLKLCICQAGYAGDGITCNDVNECEANENPCENQKGSRCVNIQGGYICCGGDVDDDRCIQDQGAFCAGGCGLHAVCYNQTCRCMEGFIGDPLNKCIDVNECESDKMCTGVGQWCINKIGGHICCGPDSLEKECNQAQLTSDGEIETANALARGEEFVERGGQSKSSSGGTIVTNQGRGALPGAGGADNGPLACTSYCPGYSECLEGFCKCSKGYFGNPVNGCEDIDECATGTPCPISRDEWCVNTLGGYHCCSVTSNQTDCIGLEIGPSGIKLTGTAESTEFPVVSSSINESIAGGEILSEETHQVKKFEAGKIILTKEKQPSKVEIFDTKPDSGEVGLEITRDEKGLNTTSEDLIVNPEVQGRTTLKLLEATTALPGVVSTLNGASEFTTSIPITEIPIHSPDSSTQAPINNVTNTLIVEIDKNGRPIATSSSSLSSSTPTGSTSASSSTSAGPSPTGSSSTSTTDEATGSTGAGPTPTGLTPTGSTSSSSSSVSGSTESRSTFTSSSGSSVSIQSGSTKNGEKTTSAGVPEPTGATGGSTASGSGNSGTMAEGPAPTGASSTTGPGATDTTLGGASPSTSGSKTEGPTPTGASATTTTGTSSLNPSGGPSTTGSSKTETPTPTSASSTTTGGSTSSLTTSVGPNGEKITTESGGSSNTTSGGSITTSSGGPTPTGLSPTGSEGSPSEAGATLGSTEAPEKHAVESNTSEGTAKPLVAELAKPTSVEDEDLILGATKSSSTPSSTPSASTEFTTKEGHINIRITTAEETATTASESTKTSGAPEATSEIKNPLDGFPEGTVIHEEGSNGTKSSGSSFTAPNAPKIPGLEREPTSIIDTEGPGVHGTKDEGTGKPEGPNGPGKTGLGKAAKPGRQGPDEKGDGKAKTPKEGTESTAAPGNTDKGETGPTSSSKTSPSGSKGSDSGETPSGQSTTEGPTSEGSPSGGTTLAPDGSEPTVQTFGSRNESSGGRVEIRTGTFAPTHPSSTGDDSSEGTTVTSSGTSGTSPTSSEVPGATDAPDELWTGKPLGTTTTDNSVPDEGELGLEIKHVGQTGAPAPEFTTSGPSETPESKGTTDNPDTVIDGDNPNGSVENGEKPPKGKTEEGGIKPTEPGTTKGEKGESTTGTTGNTVTGTTPAKVTPASGEMGLEIIHHGTTTTPKATTPEEGLEITGGFPTTPELGLEISGHTTSSPPPKNETDSATHAPKPKEEKGGEKTHEKGTEGEDKPDVIKDSEEETENKGGEHKPTGKPDIDLRSGEDPDSVGKDNKGNKKTTITSSAEVINSSPRPGDKDSEEGSEGTHAPTKEVTATTTTPSLSTAAATIIPQESTVSPTSGSTEGVTSPTLTTPESTAAPTGTTVSGSSTGPKDPSSGTTVQNRKPDLNSTTETPLEVTTLEETSAPLTATLPTKDTFSLPGSTTSLPEIASPANKTKCTSSDECGNDAYCERRTGGCRCYPGFAGMPPHNKCEDVDECADGLHNCHETARCHNYVGGYSCFCPMGFRKVDGGKCEDINECSESGNGCCSLNATCINKEGSYGCSCKEGFTGDGYNCLPITSRPCMESEWNASGCGSHHLCLISSNGKTDCSMCKMGFKMVDGTCTDVNECVEPGLNMCSKNADCNNILGTYTCTCKKGYKGDGYMCEDEDECRLSPCHPLADCTNSPGSYNCSCPEGFKGDGFKLCQNPNELACENVEDFCGRSKHTACLSVRIFDQTLTSVCECEPNYRFNQKTKQCEDIDECAENRHNCDPASAICVNEDGGFRCDCAEGYEGMGGVCVDVDECERGVAGCHSMAMCINQPGSCGCKCMKGMTGDGIQCSNLTSTTTPDTRVIDNSCTAEWQRVCRLENKTCHVDEEDVPQCGSCIEGHQPSNGSCQPLQEKGNCADPKKNNCDPNAECIDVNPGRHFCTCRVGYIGDGMRCDGPNCHLDSRLCDANATCNKNGSCICNQGFEGDGIKACNAIASTSSAPTAPPTSATSPSTTATKEESTTAPTTTTQTAFATSPTPLATEVPIDEDLVINKPADPSPPLGAGKCSPQDRSNCHELAICEASTGTCRCKNGFTGNGHSVCKPIPATDCVVDATLCTGSATCDHHTRKCVCPMGFIGDGFLCSPDPQDCVIRKDLCSTDALCAGRRCQCNPGFTGDGIKCVSLHQRSSNCSECDDNAHCNGGMCECNIGYFGNGLCCVPDPRDCVHFPGICHPEASCDTAKRSCQCSSGHLGDGISCFPTSSCRSNPSICHPDAICLPTGTCLCQHGYEGNGNSCTKVTPHHRAVLQDVPSACGNRCDTLSQLCIEGSCVCKHGFSLKEDAKCHDINECDANPCHHLATCANLPGSYLCSCPDGYAGDGKSCIEHIKIGQLAVFCEPDGMTLLLGNDTESFEGRMFVRGQAENPHCSKTFSTLSQHDKPYTFKVPFEHCNVRLENHDTFATTVIVQKHPMFITTNADSFDLRCTYPTGVKEVVSHVNVSELNTSSVLTDEGAGPLCKLTVTNEHEENINSATVGESLTLKLEVSPNDTYSILPRNCFAINIETGERYSLTDRAGCAIDDQLFPEWTRIRPSLTQALFRTFKWPDSSMIRFQCDCSACVGDCPVIDCAKRRDAAMRRFRFRRVRHTQNGTEAADRIEDAADYEDESEDRLLQKLVDPKRLAFSSLMTIHEDVEETRAQQQLEHWRTGMSKESDVIAEAARDASVCVRTILIIMSVALVCLCIGLILVLCIRYIQASRRAQYQKDTLSVTSSAPVSIIGY